MIQSRYNHYIERGDFSYWYNPHYNQFFRLPVSLGSKLNAYLSEHGSLQELSETLHRKFIDSGFLVEEDVDEIEMVREKYRKAIDRKDAFLIILPTLNCNYKCWYCIQHHIVSMMSEETMEAVLRHVDYLLEVEKIDSLHVDWFGGEPFMFYRQVVKPMSEAIIRKCEEAGVPFMNSSTTNAYYLTDEVTRELGDLRFSFFQITLDGDREHHDKVKFMKGLDSAFDRSLANISRMLRENDGMRVLLRINYTHSNMTEGIVDEVCDRIPEGVRGRITVMPRKVWQEEVDRSFGEVVDRIVRMFSERGFHVEITAPIQNFMPCYASSKHYRAISYNGHVLKCTCTQADCTLPINPSCGVSNPGCSIGGPYRPNCVCQIGT